MKWSDIFCGNIKLKPNDRVFTHGKKGISTYIRIFSGLNDLITKDEPTFVNHVAVISKADYMADKPDLRLMEAIFPKFTENPLKKYDDGETGVVIIRDITNTDLDNLHVLTWIRAKYIGKFYNVPAIVGQLTDSIIGFILRKRFILFSKMNLLKLPICSRAIAMADSKVLDKNFGVNSAAASPDDMLDFYMDHLKTKCKIIFANDSMQKKLEKYYNIEIGGDIVVSP